MQRQLLTSIVGAAAFVLVHVAAVCGIEPWQANGQGPRPVGMGAMLEGQPRAGGLGMELATNGWPRIFRHAVPYYSIESYNGSVGKQFPQGDFGTIQPAGATFRAATVRSRTWTTAQMRFEAMDGKAMDAWVSRVSPAALFQSEADALVLFANGRAKPAYVATRNGGDIAVRPIDKAGELPLKQFKNSWLLVWFGKQANFNAVDYPMPTDMRDWVAGPHYAADCPFLIVFQNSPVEITSGSGGLGVRFAGAAGSIAVLPLFGALHPKADDTEKWAAGLPAQVVAAADFWSEHLAEVPVAATESYGYDPAADRVTITTTIAYQRLRDGGQRLAPLPPMLAIARQYGLPMKLSAEPTRTSVVTPWGPYEGIEGVDSYTAEMTGLGKYVLEHPSTAAQAKETPELHARLESEVTKVLEAGHLAPWYIAMTDFGAGYQYYWRMQHELCWARPGDTLEILAACLPALSTDLAAKTKDYIQRERTAYPPEKIAHTPVAEGARRERYTLDPALLADQEKRVRQNNPFIVAKALPEESLYDLATYYRALGQKPDAQQWQSAKAILDPYLMNLDWATGEFLKRAGAAQFTMNGPGGAPDANAHFAGAVGYIRLARMAGDRDAEMLGWGILARAAIARFAIEKYPRFLSDSGLYVLPKEPDWMIRFTRGGWTGRLFTNNWTGPQDDVRSIARMDQFGVQFDDTLDWYHGTGLPKLRGLTPELARFMKDHLSPEIAAFVARVEQNSPNWYLALPTTFVGAEFFYQQPQESYNLFLAKAWILDETPARLEEYLDVSWMARGDLFYIRKLAETIGASRGVQWQKE